MSADTLLNRKGQIWRKIPEEVRANTQDNPEQMRALMLENPGIIKRPVVVFPNGAITVGLSEDLWTILIDQLDCTNRRRPFLAVFCMSKNDWSTLDKHQSTLPVLALVLATFFWEAPL